jgi:hypothetical protein
VDEADEEIVRQFVLIAELESRMDSALRMVSGLDHKSARLGRAWYRNAQLIVFSHIFDAHWIGPIEFTQWKDLDRLTFNILPSLPNLITIGFHSIVSLSESLNWH